VHPGRQVAREVLRAANRVGGQWLTSKHIGVRGFHRFGTVSCADLPPVRACMESGSDSAGKPGCRVSQWVSEEMWRNRHLTLSLEDNSSPVTCGFESLCGSRGPKSKF